MQFKRLTITTLFSFFVFLGSFAQSGNRTAEWTPQLKQESKGNSSVSYQFSLDANDISLQEVSDKGKLYTKFIAASCESNKGRIDCQVHLLKDEFSNQMVFKRYLMNLGVTQIQHRNDSYTRDEFFDRFVLTEKE